MCDLPIELLTTLVFSELSPFDLARLCQVNVLLNNAVCQFLAHIKCFKMPNDREFPCAKNGRRPTIGEMTAHRRKCLNFMVRHTNNLVVLSDDSLEYRMLNTDLIRVVKKNPKLEIFYVRRSTISHPLLKQLLLWEKLSFLRKIFANEVEPKLAFYQF